MKRRNDDTLKDFIFYLLEVFDMTAKEYLKQAYYLDGRINSDLQELSELRAMAYSISSPSMERNNNPNRSTNATFVKSLERLSALEKIIDEEVDNFVRLKGEIRNVIDEIENHDQQMLLRYRYIHLYTWEKIESKMHYSHRWIHTLHGKALKAVDAVLKKKNLI